MYMYFTIYSIIIVGIILGTLVVRMYPLGTHYLHRPITLVKSYLVPTFSDTRNFSLFKYAEKVV